MQELLDKLPEWDKKLAEKLEPIKPYISFLLVLLAILIIYAALKWDPHYQLLFFAYLIAP
jgi:hypothetical protein